jgi:hypothetical protein
LSSVAHGATQKSTSSISKQWVLVRGPVGLSPASIACAGAGASSFASSVASGQRALLIALRQRLWHSLLVASRPLLDKGVRELVGSTSTSRSGSSGSTAGQLRKSWTRAALISSEERPVARSAHVRLHGDGQLRVGLGHLLR